MLRVQCSSVQYACFAPGHGTGQAPWCTPIGAHCGFVVAGHCQAFNTSMFQVMRVGCQDLYAA